MTHLPIRLALLASVATAFAIAAAPAQAQQGNDVLDLFDGLCVEVIEPLDVLDPLADPILCDADSDDVANPIDNCPELANPQQEDADKDGRGDACDSTGGAPGAQDPPAEDPPDCKVTAIGAYELAPGRGAFFGTVLEGSRSLTLLATTDMPTIGFGTQDADRVTCAADNTAMSIAGQGILVRGDKTVAVDYTVDLVDGGAAAADDRYRLRVNAGESSFDTGSKPLAFGGVEIEPAATS